MENYPIKVVGIEFSESCPEHLIEPTKKYFQLNDSLEFDFKPGTVKRKFKLSNDDMWVIQKETKLVFKILCPKCQSYLDSSVTSQSKLNRILSEIKDYGNTFLCHDCLIIEKEVQKQKYEQQKEKKRKKELERDRKVVKELNEAIDNKKWRELNPFQFEVMKNCLLLDSFYELKQYYWDLDPTSHGFKSFFSVLRILDKKGLIVTHSKFDHHRGYPVITDYKYLDRLKRDFEYDFEVEVKKPDKKKNTKTTKSGFTNSLKMKLTINDYQNHPDSPLYAGKVIFKEKIVIDPDIEYVFGQWERKNDDLYFTLVPAHELDKLPVQKKLSHEPKAVQEHITDFLNNITIDK